MNEAIRMQLSAFADGELPDNEKELLLRRLSQDAEMRRQVAEYLAIGRVMRGEAPVPGIENLRDRVAAAIGVLEPLADESASPPADETRPAGRRFARPAAGLAAAAVVASLAILGLQRMPETPDPAVIAPNLTAPNLTAGEQNFSTQPEPENLLDQFRLMHEAESGDSSMRTRLTTIELRQDLAEGAGDDALPAGTAGDADGAGPDDETAAGDDAAQDPAPPAATE